MQRLYVIFCLLLIWTLGESRNPGFKARITQKGLSYANTTAILALKSSVEKVKIPDISGSSGKIKYSVSNIRVTQFTPPSSSLTLEPGQGLKWIATNAAVAMAGDFHFKALFIKGSGSFTASVSGVSFSLAIQIGTDTTGRPKISTSPSNCSASVGDVNFKFHGDISWLLNIFRDKVANIIKDQLNQQMCTLLDKEINSDGDKKLADIPVTAPLAKKFLLDYRLSSDPQFTKGYMETFHKGEVYWLSEPTSEAPMSAPAMTDSSDVDRMLYLWVSDYVFNSMMYQAQKHGFLLQNLTAKDLPAGSRDVLNTSCAGFIPKCVGALISEIGQKYPNGRVELNINSTSMPQLSITSAGGTVTGAGTINMYARVPGRTDTPFLVTLYATMTTTVDVSLKNELLYASVKDLSLNLKAGKSDVGPVHDEFLSFLIKEALNVYFIPKLNDIGGKGFPLPITKEIKFVNSKVAFTQDTIMIATDLQYTPSFTGADDSGPLKFVPYNKLQSQNKPVHI